VIPEDGKRRGTSDNGSIKWSPVAEGPRGESAEKKGKGGSGRPGGQREQLGHSGSEGGIGGKTEKRA